MREKRGQITLFIIIGILIVALAGVFLYIRGEKLAVEEPEVIPQEFVPLKEYVDECVKMTLTQGVLLMGQQAGYLYPPEYIKNDPTSFLAPVPGGEFRVPYWYHEGKSRVPLIKDMESQLSQYLNSNLKACLRNFTDFNDRFDIEEIGNITSKTTIGVNEVITTLKYPLNVGVKGTGEKTRIATFSGDTPVKLRRMYELAVDIMAAENLQMFMEDLTIDLMALGPDIPFTDVIFQCGQLKWYKKDVESDIKDLLYYNLPKIKFRGTNHEPFLELEEKYENLRQYDPEEIAAGNTPKDVPADAYDYFHFYWDAASKEYKDLSASVLFQKDWLFQMNARPSQGEVMSASYGTGYQKYLSYLCINMYHFTYDITYPVMVVISDDTAMQGKGYKLKFAFPVLINHNQGDRTNFPLSAALTPAGNDGGYCQEKTNQVYEIRPKDANTFEDIKGAEITFNCMNTYYCSLGQTKADGGLYRLRTKVPSFCSPGAIDAKHEDYLDVTEEIPEDSFYVPIMMTPLKKLSFSAKKYRLTAGEMMPQEALEPGEYAVIYLRSDNFTDYNMYRKYPADADSGEDFSTIKIPAVDAVYDLDVILMSREDEPIGGYRSKVSMKGSDISSASTITFNSLEMIPHPATDDEKAMMLINIGNQSYTGRASVEIG